MLTKKNNESLPQFLARLWNKSGFDGWLFFSILLLEIIGLLVLYSASNQNYPLVVKQITKFIISIFAMLFFASTSIDKYRSLAPWFYTFAVVLLIAVAAIGMTSKGGQRWIELGAIHFQPSEIMKFAMPMMLAWYLQHQRTPIEVKNFLIAVGIILLPVIMIAKQPDLGTALLVMAIGSFTLLLAGVNKRLIFLVFCLAGISLPVIWHFMYPYQKMRILMFLSPELDPFNTGYNIIQSKIAIGSGGWWGKGWLQGTQASLKFLPEAATDFAFAVYCEEFGFVGVLLLFAVFAFICGRCLHISTYAQDPFSRLFAGSITLSFFLSFLINIGMTSGLLPVVGVPLPFISYGGSSLVTFMISFGIIMSIQSHRKLIST
jgi:rod shape-determining protein RodA